MIRLSIQSHYWIRERAVRHRMIEPFSEKQVAAGVLFRGISSYAMACDPPLSLEARDELDPQC